MPQSCSNKGADMDCKYHLDMHLNRFLPVTKSASLVVYISVVNLISQW